MNDRNKNRPGYKETKVGWIPEEWNDPKLGKHMKCFSGGTPKSGMREYYKGEIPWIKSGELNQKNIHGTDECITEEAVKNSSAKFVESGTLLYALYGATAGVPGFTQIQATINQAVLAILPKPNLSKHFCYFWFYSEKNRLIARYTQGGQPNLSGTIVKSFHIPLPPLPEQEAIAEVLSCWDEGLESLEKLIAAKKLRKKGLMQQLLTGEKRLPGFSKCWKEVSLGSISKAVKKAVGDKKVTPMSLSAGKGFVPQAEKFGRDISGKQYSKYTLLTKGCFTYNKGNSIRYPQGCAYLLEDRDEVAVPNVFISFKLDEKNTDNKFFQQIFAANMHGKDLMKFINSGVRNDGLLNLTTAWFFKIKFTIPSVDEQKAIAAVLETADGEIRLLEAERDALSEQKKGLMQKLLTGEVRHPEFVKERA